METILNFLVDNYLWFLIISLILIFGLIGYIVDSREKKTPKLHFGEETESEVDLVVAEEGKSLKELLEENDKVENGENKEIVNPEITPVVIESIDDNNENIEDELPKG